MIYVHVVVYALFIRFQKVQKVQELHESSQQKKYPKYPFIKAGNRPFAQERISKYLR